MSKFSERLNQELDDIGVPEQTKEREEIFAKLAKIPRFKASALLSGALKPNPELLQLIADELEVSITWLKGESNSRNN